MFTGIVQATAVVVSIHPERDGTMLTLTRPKSFRGLHTGASVAVDGVCLTVSGSAVGTIQFDCAPQTLKLTRLGSLQVGESVNLERPLRMGTELGGHFVSGHVDAMGTVRAVHKDRGYWLTVSIPVALKRYCPARGSISINGVSLTIARSRGRLVGVTLIPTTLRQTNLGQLTLGDVVNIEIDLIARYVEKLIQQDK